MNSKIINSDISKMTPEEKWLADYKEQSCVVYPENQFAMVSRLRDNVYAICSEAANARISVWSYVIVGPERALAIDTGFGIGDYKATVERLAGGKPYDVVVTHDHPDHIGGASRFERMFCHKDLLKTINKERGPFRFNGVVDENGSGIYLAFDRSDVVEHKEYELVPCEDGYIFDLGEGYEVKLLHTPGHCAGGCSLLDKQSRMIFVGDNVQNGHIACPGHEEGSCVHNMIFGLENIVKNADDYDLIMPGHNAIPVEKSCAATLLDVCRGIVAAPENYDAEGRDPMGINKVYFKNVGDFARIEYKLHAV